MDTADLGTFSDVLFYLENRGIEKDSAREIVTTVFGWGINAAMDRLRPTRPVPCDMPAGSAEQLAAIEPPPPRPAKKKTSRPAMVQRRIPNDFALNDERAAYAKSRGFRDSQVVEMMEEFIGYYRKTGKPWADWDAVWQGWVRRQVERMNQHRGPDNHAGGGFL